MRILKLPGIVRGARKVVVVRTKVAVDVELSLERGVIRANGHDRVLREPTSFRLVTTLCGDGQDRVVQAKPWT